MYFAVHAACSLEASLGCQKFFQYDPGADLAPQVPLTPASTTLVPLAGEASVLPQLRLHQEDTYESYLMWHPCSAIQPYQKPVI